MSRRGSSRRSHRVKSTSITKLTANKPAKDLKTASTSTAPTSTATLASQPQSDYLTPSPHRHHFPFGLLIVFIFLVIAGFFGWRGLQSSK